MNDLISRQAAIDVAHRAIFDFFDICSDDDESPITYKDEQLLEINKAITTQIRKLPSAQPERKKGRWVESETDGFICSVCRNGYKNQPTCMGKPMFDFCPMCGADMRGEQDG